LKKVLFFLFILTCPKLVFGQDCSLLLKGKVTSSDGLAVESVSVNLSPGSLGTVTDGSGYFQFKNLCAGTYTVVVRHVGYQMIRETISLKKNLEVSFTLIGEVQELEAVVVHEESHQEGIMVAGLNRAELDALAGKSLGETLKELPGVGTIQAGPGVSKPVIHGVHGQRILILNNGVRLEGQQWGAEHAPEIDPFIASEIQVIKDASSIRHGVDAIGGVVIVTPPALPEEPGLGGYLQTIGQSNGQSGTISGSLQGGINGKKGWGWRVQGTARKSGDFNAANYTLTNTGLRESNVSGALGYHGAQGGIEVFASRFATDIGILSGSVSSSVSDLATAIASEKPRYTRPFSYSIDNPSQSVIHHLVKLNGHYASSFGTWRWMYAWQQNNRQEFDIRRGGLSELPAIDLKLTTHSYELEWEQPKGKATHIRIGSTGMFQSNENIYGTQRIPFIPDYTSVTGGFYSIVNAEQGNLKMDAGVRYDIRYYDVAGFDFKNTLYRQSMLFHNVSATAGLSLSRPNGHLWSTSLSSAWRPPHVAELFSLGTHQSAAAIEYGLFLDPLTNQIRDREDVDFSNEQSLKWVGGWKISREKFMAEATVYSNLIFNYFYLRPGGITRNIRGAYPYFRYAQTTALFTGFDFEASWGSPLEGLVVSPKISLLHASNITDRDYLVFIPANRMELSLSRDFTGKKSNRSYHVGLRNRYVFRQYRAPRVIAPEAFLDAETPVAVGDRMFDFMAAPDGYYLAGASAGYTIKSEKIRYDFRITAENLFNKAYREYTNRFRYYADELGRNLIFSIKMTF